MQPGGWTMTGAATMMRAVVWTEMEKRRTEVMGVSAEEVLRRVPLFRGLRPQELKSMAKFTVSRNYQAGEIIVEEGQLGFGLYCIDTGRVKVTQRTSQGEREIRTMGPGESCGEISLIDDQPRAATVTAVEPTSAVLLDKMQFAVELRHHPDVAIAVMRSLVQWLREADRTIASLA
jgi:CRP-like cAMP-binding protein